MIACVGRWSSMVLWVTMAGLAVGCAGDAPSELLDEGERRSPLPRSGQAQADGGLASLLALPWPERLGLEQAMAARNPRYTPRQTGQTLSLRSPRAGAMEVDGSGARLELGATIALAALGRDGVMGPVGEAQVGVRGPAVERRFARGVVEWWRALPSGLEHGVTLQSRPTGTGVLLLEVSLTGLEAKGEGPTLSLRDGSGAVRAHYGHLWVQDASGAEVPSRLLVTADGLRIEVRDQDAVYPLEVDPLVWTEEAHLFASDGATGDIFGYSVSLSADGARALVGARLDDTAAGANAGSAYVFARVGTTWTEEAHLVASDGAAGDQFGHAVSLSADGSRALVGAYVDDTAAGAIAGSAYVFTRLGATWTEEAHLFASDGAVSDFFGYSVSLSADGSRALIGANADDTAAGANAGSAYVFARVGTTWTEEAHLFASDGAAADELGWSVSLSGDGIRALVGAHFDDTVGGGNAGSAYLFARSGATWTEEAHLLAVDGALSDEFGYSVSLSGDGSRALVGAYVDDTAVGGNAGSVYLFARVGTTWTTEAHLFASDAAAGDWFGWSVSLTADGNRALVGARFDDTAAALDAGSAYVFARLGGIWTEEAHLFASDAALSDLFGWSVSLSADGGRALIAAASDDTAGGATSGSAYVFAGIGTLGTPCTGPGSCASGFCSDGVCCDSACGGGAPGDCEACSVAAGAVTDGTCDLLGAAYTCRASAGVCDVAESCDGLAASCPADVVASSATECRAAADACDLAESCDGLLVTCPADARMTGCVVDAGMDAGTDAGMDAGTDASADASLDSGTDASADGGAVADASADAGPLAPADTSGCCTVAAGRSGGRTGDPWLLGALLALLALGRLRRRS